MVPVSWRCGRPRRGPPSSRVRRRLPRSSPAARPRPRRCRSGPRRTRSSTRRPCSTGCWRPCPEIAKQLAAPMASIDTPHRRLDGRRVGAAQGRRGQLPAAPGADQVDHRAGPDADRAPADGLVDGRGAHVPPRPPTGPRPRRSDAYARPHDRAHPEQRRALGRPRRAGDGVRPRVRVRPEHVAVRRARVRGDPPGGPVRPRRRGRLRPGRLRPAAVRLAGTGTRTTSCRSWTRSTSDRWCSSGHSVSAMIGVLAAARRPELFDRLVLVGPSPRYVDDGDYRGGFSAAEIDELLATMDDNYLGWSAFIAPVIMGNADRPELGEELTNSFCRTDPAIARRFARTTFLADNRADLAGRHHAGAGAPVPRGRHRAPGGRPVRARAPGGQRARAPGRRRALPQPQRAGPGRRGHHRVPGPCPRPMSDAWDVAPVALLRLDGDGTILDANRVLLDWVGRPAQGLRLADLLSVGGRIYWETHLSPLLHMQGRFDEVAVELRGPDGRLPVLVSAVVHTGDDGGRRVDVALSRATERSRYERELLAARTAADRSADQLRALQATTAALSQGVGTDGVARALVDTAVTHLGAVTATVWIAAEDGTLVRRATSGAGAGRHRRAGRALGPGTAGDARTLAGGPGHARRRRAARRRRRRRGARRAGRPARRARPVPARRPVRRRGPHRRRAAGRTRAGACADVRPEGVGRPRAPARPAQHPPAGRRPVQRHDRVPPRRPGARGRRRLVRRVPDRRRRARGGGRRRRRPWPARRHRHGAAAQRGPRARRAGRRSCRAAHAAGPVRRRRQPSASWPRWSTPRSTW